MINIVMYTDNEKEIELVKKVINKLKLKNLTLKFFFDSPYIENYIDCFSDEQNIYILSIEMVSGSGLDIASKIRKQDKSALIIFMANDERFMSTVFKFVTFDYLIKPLDKSSVKQLFLRIGDYLERLEYFSFFYKRIKHAVKLSEIIYFEKYGRTAYIYTINEIYRCNKSMQEITRQLSGSFVQVHCSYTVNLQYVSKFKKDELLLCYKNGKEKIIEKCIPVGRSFRKELEQSIFL